MNSAHHDHLKIIKLELPTQDGHHYDVMLRLCRPLTTHEVHEVAIHRSIGLEVSPDDPSLLIAAHTTVEEVRDRLPEFHGMLATASAAAHAAQDTATHAQEVLATEETRRQALVDDTNLNLGAGPNNHDPAVGAT
ncbi:hypothetical protein JRC04_01805 [Mycolicibacterium sp. S2-37]|uniref:hypothetical protein n=1 Tax=Mycolicibacterium sp. S2-37 TaxID=2810297 RepID=UPI001A93CD6D|nr:hypothetical protein [Mycolicibacterium sp. S2-37]MBO0676192.1 hypothetical protein [Mycolicibacterium sp. S2-37]